MAGGTVHIVGAGLAGLAAAVGLLVVFTPAGLGARDVVVVLTLSSVMPRSAATAARGFQEACRGTLARGEASR